MQSFVDANEYAPVGQFYLLRQRIPDLAKVPSLVQTEVDDNQEQVRDKLAEMDSLANVHAGQSLSTSDSTLQRYEELSEDVLELYEVNDSIFEDLDADRIALADSLLVMNDSINAVEIYELNQKNVFDIFLNTIGKGDTTATTAQLDTLENIAAQCIEEGGRAVWEAIVLYRALTHTVLELVDSCEVEERAGENSISPTRDLFTLYPNPANGVCHASYSLEKGQTGELMVSDAFGKQVVIYSLDDTDGIIQLDNLPSGIYFIRLSVNGKVLQTEKLVKS